METGCVVSDLGMCSTPAAKLMVTQLGAAAGIILTASHNPAPWNGLKLVRADGLFLNGTQGAQVESLYHSGNVVQRGGGRIEQLPRDEIDGPYLDRILSAVDVELIRSASLRVAADPCNGAGALLLHQLFDRVALVAEDGIPVGEDFTLALAVQAVLASPAPPGPVVTTLSTSQIVSDAAQRSGRSVILTDIVPGRDAALGIALVLQRLAIAGKALSELVADLPQYAIDKRKVSDCTAAQLERGVGALRETRKPSSTPSRTA